MSCYLRAAIDLDLHLEKPLDDGKADSVDSQNIFDLLSKLVKFTWFDRILLS